MVTLTQRPWCQAFDFAIQQLKRSKNLSPLDGTGLAILQFDVEGSGSPRPILGFDPGDVVIQWSADGRSLLVTRIAGMPIKVYRLDLITGHKELLKEVTPADPAGIKGPNNIFMTPDGKSYVYKLARFLRTSTWSRG